MKGTIVALLVGLAFHASAQQPPPQLTIAEQIAFGSLAEKRQGIATQRQNLDSQQHNLDQLDDLLRADVKKNHPGYPANFRFSSNWRRMYRQQRSLQAHRNNAIERFDSSHLSPTPRGGCFFWTHIHKFVASVNKVLFTSFPHASHPLRGSLANNSSRGSWETRSINS